MDGILKLGEHYILDFSGCDREMLIEGEQAHALFAQAVRDSGLTIVNEGYYPFSPHGFTCFLLLAESHASLHSWPEYGYAAIDLFTCSLELDVRPLVNQLQAIFGAQKCSIRRIDRTAVAELFPALELAHE